jgi:5-methylcytosine-specific restriction endonuclease McrA
VPTGDVAVVFDRALSALIEHLEKQKCASTSRPREPRAGAPASRHVPAAVRREVWRRDEGRCAFIGARGRCTERGFLEFHHVVPFAAGGSAVANNIQLRCSTISMRRICSSERRWSGRQQCCGADSVRTEL